MSEDEDVPFGFRLSPELLRQIEAMRKTVQAVTAQINLQMEPVREALANVNVQFEGFRPQIEAAFEAARPAFERLQHFRDNWVPNFKGAEWNFGGLQEMVTSDGIPLMWLPRAEIVSELMTLEDRDQRYASLLAHATEIVDDCEAVITGCDSTTLGTSVDLTQKALRAWRGGHVEAAQALAVLVAEWLISHNFERNYKNAAERAQLSDETTLFELRNKCALAPVTVFYTEWWEVGPKAGPPPTQLSRHVTVHHGAGTEQFTDINALLSLMLTASLIREFQEAANESTSQEDEPVDE